MKIFKAIALGAAITVAMPPAVELASAATIDLGKIRIQLPRVVKKRSTSRSSRSTQSAQENYATHPRWSTVLEGTYRMATNGQGIWIGYDDTGAMVMQLELPSAVGAEQGSTVPVQVEINGRYYDSVVATVANESVLVVHGPEVERILGRLMSGRTVTAIAGANRVATHLRGSSAAIGEVRSEARLQARLFQSGQVVTGETAATEQPAGSADAPKDEEVTLYFLPGVAGYGVADVRFNIQEGRGLVIYMQFEGIEGHEDPQHQITMNPRETGRAVNLIRKAEEWTEIARNNRVGLFSKRIGYIDDGLAEAEEAAGEASAPGKEPAGEPAGESAEMPSGEIGKQAEENTAMGPEQPEAAPKDFRAVNFNSYENGDTSVQIEHSVGGYSRRFNFTLDEAMEFADFLENTVKVRSQQFENRELSEDEKEKLFQ